ncbi:MAG: glycosyltransferase family 39 protein [Candidatus Shapirobacteria bacterium]|nr:glycosyltransferase family 39 protein [Candidatus Shapirobacteria bacterium]
MKYKNKIFILIIFIIAFLLRIYGLNWDQGNHLHPDERFLTMVSADISLPKNIFEYFNTKISPLNPVNKNYDFYAYGTFPLLLTRSIAEFLNFTAYDQIFLVGRIVSAIFDSLTVLLVFLISLKIFKKHKIAILGAFLYSICIFPIQQSHFFTVDSFTVFFFTLTILLMFSKKPLLSGLIFGITLANKTSVGITLPLLLLFIFIQNKYPPANNRQILKKYLIDGFFNCCLFFVFTIIAFRIFQPYAFDGFIKFSPNFVSNIKEAHQMITGEIDYPPNIQWKNTIPIIHPLSNLLFFGLGPVTFILLFFGTIKILKDNKLIKQPQIIALLLISLIIFLYHSFLLAKYMRYSYPIYPIFVILAGYGLSFLSKKLFFLIISINIIIAASFLNIYNQPHSRYQSSEWICQNISTKSVLSSEIWDDSLPLFSPSCINKSYFHQELSLFDTESSQKWTKINEQLTSINYLILSSNRLWGSIPKVSERYPDTSNFYKNLFEGKTDFKLLKRIYSYPGFYLPFINKCVLIGPSVYPQEPNTFFEIDQNCDYPGIYFRDDAAEESFTVYDHPQVNIFIKLK